MVAASCLAVRADQRHGVQTVQRNPLALIPLCTTVTSKLVARQSHFLKHRMGLRIGSEAAQLK